VPEGDFVVPIGKGEVKKEGKDITVIAYSAMVQRALETAKVLEKEGISVEVVDPRTILPLDEDIILRSIEKTGKAVIVHEAPTFGGFGGEIAGLLADKGFDYLDGPVKRVGGLFCPIPFSLTMEQLYLPGVDRIIQAVHELIEV
jgi:pyruvate dehydrogenase E1 component beta subunit